MQAVAEVAESAGGGTEQAAEVLLAQQAAEPSGDSAQSSEKPASDEGAVPSISDDEPSNTLEQSIDASAGNSAVPSNAPESGAGEAALEAAVEPADDAQAPAEGQAATSEQDSTDGQDAGAGGVVADDQVVPDAAPSNPGVESGAAEGGDSEAAAAEASTTSDEDADAQDASDKEDEESTSPAIDVTTVTPNGVVVKVHAPKGAFPQGTSVRVVPADATRLLIAADSIMDGEAMDACAVDISFVRDGVELEPATGQAVSVSLRLQSDVQGEEHKAIHLRDDGTAEVVGVASAQRADFTATDFSVYGIVGDGGEVAVKRAKVSFKDADGGDLGSVTVRSGDTIQAPTAPPSTDQSQVFSRWQIGETDASAYLGRGLSATQIDALAAMGVEAGEDDPGLYLVEATAVYTGVCFVRLHQGERDGQDSAVVSDVLTTDADGKVSLGDSSFTAPEGSRLVKWLEANGTEHATDEVLTLSTDLDLWPVLEPGYWIRYDLGEGLGGLGATWVNASEMPKSSSSLPSPDGNTYNKGYTFAGWYTDSGRMERVPNQLTLTSDIKLYAKWNEANTTYTIIQWVEDHEGGPGQGNYTPYATIQNVSGSTGKAIVLSYANNGINNRSIASYHPNQEKTNAAMSGVTVAGDGSTVVNFYYDRDWWNLTFSAYSDTINVGPYKWGQSLDGWYANPTLATWLNSYHFNAYGFNSGNNYLPKLNSMPKLSGSSYSSGASVTWSRSRDNTNKVTVNFYREVPAGFTGTGFNGRTFTKYKTGTYDGSTLNSMEIEGLSGYRMWCYRINNRNASYISATTGTINLPSFSGTEDVYYILKEYRIDFLNTGDQWVNKSSRSNQISGIKYTSSLSAYDPHYDSVKTGSLGQTYKFAGWFTSQDAANDPLSPASASYKFDFSSETMPSNNIVLYGGWVPEYYDVAFNSNGGTRVATQEGIAGGDLATEPDAPTKEGFEFAGWYTDPDFTSRWDFESNAVMKSLTLYARWVSTESFAVSYYDGDGNEISGLDDVRYSYNAYVRVAGAPSTSNADGEVFVGWGTDPDKASSVVGSGFNITGDTELFAIYQDVADSEEELVVLLESNYPERFAESDPVTEELIAKGANGTVQLPLALDGASAPGYEITGWSVSPSGAGAVFTPGDRIGVASATTLYAVWEPMDDTLEYDANAADATGSVRTATGKVYSTTRVMTCGYSRSGYTFESWNTAADGSGDTYVPGMAYEFTPETDRLYAQWREVPEEGSEEPESATLSYEPAAEDATGSTGPTVGEKGSYVPVAGNGFQRAGYAFTGWNTEQDGSGTAYAPLSGYLLEDDAVLYAQWEGSATSLVYDGNGATSGQMASTTGRVGEQVNLAGNAFARTNYEFAGWNTRADGTGDAYEDGAAYTFAASGNRLYAQWRAASGTNDRLTYNKNAASATGTTAPTYGATGSDVSVAANGFSNRNYEFVGWNTEPNGTGAFYAAGSKYLLTDGEDVLYAQWVPTDDQLSYNGNGAEGSVSPTVGRTGTAVVVAANGSEDAEGFVNPGFVFTGWNTRADGLGNSYAPGSTFALTSGNDVLYAQWRDDGSRAHDYLRYDANAEDAMGSMLPTEGLDSGSVDIPACGFAREGYVFDSWNTKADGTGDSYQPGKKYQWLNADEDDVLYAQWKPASELTASDIDSLEYVANAPGGITPEGTTPATQGKTGSSVPVAECGYTAGNYRFTGWNTKADGSGTWYPAGATYTLTTGADTLYAQWELNTDVLRYDPNAADATGATGSTIGVLGQKVVVAACEYIRAGFAFLWWNSLADGSGAVYRPGDLFELVQGATLYAQWGAADDELAYDANGGAGSMDATSGRTGGQVTVASNGFTAPSGKAFRSWNTKADGTGTTVTPGSLFTLTVGEDKLYAQWVDMAMLTLDANLPETDYTGSTGSVSVPKGADATVPACGYTSEVWEFQSWNTEANGTGTRYDAGAVIEVSEDTTLYAQWAAADPTGILYPNGGIGGAKKLRKDGSSELAVAGNFVTLPGADTFGAPEGKVFAGWDTAADGAGALAPGTTLTLESGQEFYAIWADKATISFDSNGGSGTVDAVSAAVGTLVVLPDGEGLAAPQAGYTFAGWNTEADGTGGGFAPGARMELEEDLTLYAQWAPNEDTARLDPNGGTGTMEPLRGNPGEKVTLPACGFTRDGYTFIGWDTDKDAIDPAYRPGDSYEIAAGVPVYAIWAKTSDGDKPGEGDGGDGGEGDGGEGGEGGEGGGPEPGDEVVQTVTLSFDAGDGTGSMPERTYVLSEGTVQAKLPACSFEAPEGYEFSGWKVGDDADVKAAGATVSLSEDTTATATWKPSADTGRLDANGGSGTMDPLDGEVGDTVQLPENGFTPPEGKVFAGWDTDPEGEGSLQPGDDYPIKPGEVVYAIWKDAIVLYANNGTDEKRTLDGASPASDEVVLPGQGDFTTPEGKVFAGWDADSKASTPAYREGSEYDADGPLYAIWADDVVTLGFDPNGGEGQVDAVSALRGESVALPENGFTYTGHTFLGWDENASATEPTYRPGDEFALQDDETLSAIWAKTSNEGGGSGEGGESGEGGGPGTGDDGIVQVATLSFDAGDGTGSMSDRTYVKDSEGKAQAKLPACSFEAPEGYEFAGWKVGDDVKAAGDTITLTEDATTATATWKPNASTGLLNSNNGRNQTATLKDASGADATVGTEVVLPGQGSFTTPRNAEFAGWATDPDAAEPAYRAGDAYTVKAGEQLYAIWNGKVTLSFKKNGGEGTMSDVVVDKGTTVSPLPGNAFSRAGYDFTGWNTAADGTGVPYAQDDSITLVRDTKLYAQWALNASTGMVEPNGGQGDAFRLQNGNEDARPGDEVSLPACPFTRDGHIFLGWDTNPDAVNPAMQPGDTHTVKANENIYAIWADACTLSFDANASDAEGTMEPVSDIRKGTSAAVPDCGYTREGYTFTNWNVKPTATGASYAGGSSKIAMNADRTLYAQWVLDADTGNLNPNGGTGEVQKLKKDGSDEDAEPGDSVTLPENPFGPPEGNEFMGWNTAADGTGTSYMPGDSYTVKAGEQLYAQWAAPADLLLDKNADDATGTMNPNPVHGYTTGITVPACGFKRAGYHFTTWNTLPDGSGDNYAPGSVYIPIAKAGGAGTRMLGTQALGAQAAGELLLGTQAVVDGVDVLYAQWAPDSNSSGSGGGTPDGDGGSSTGGNPGKGNPGKDDDSGKAGSSGKKSSDNKKPIHRTNANGKPGDDDPDSGKGSGSAGTSSGKPEDGSDAEGSDSEVDSGAEDAANHAAARTGDVPLAPIAAVAVGAAAAFAVASRRRVEG